ncbi:hypothetical protein LTR78_009065 [Recurvomyces mirabilis]|uniref:Uncharacterized protein n=1 Tax=Recurvomyces mirabilis TaxID=574656 RepID=A0AAE0TQA8_9PEZI|nr:hypothetical protein LTR78_009065 [Recurvomyces mirabilis]
MSAPRRSTREREVRYEVQPDMNEDPGSESPQHEAEEEEEEIESVDDKQRRKELYDGHYQDFLVQSEPNKLKSEHLAQRKKMWADGRERIAGEIDELEAKIGRLRAKQEQMDVAEAELEEKIGEDAEKWEDDKVKLAEWKAFFDLETDKVDV